MSGGKLPEGWVKAQLEDIVEILDSMRIPVNNKERQERIEGKDFNKLYPYYGATGEVGKIDDFIFDEELIALGEDGVPFFDGQKNKAYMLYGKTWVNNHAHVLKAIQGLSHNKFLCYFLNQFDYHDYVNGGTRLKLTQANMRKIPVHFAPFSEQKIIAEKLDTLLAQVDSTKARLEQIPQILKRFRQAALAAVVNGKSVNTNIDENTLTTLGNIAKNIKYGTSKKCSETQGSTAVLRIPNIGPGYIINSDLKYADFDQKELVTLTLKEGDLLLIRSNGSVDLVGKVAVISENDTEYLYAGYLIRVRLDKERAAPKYISYCLQSPQLRQVIENIARSTSGVNNINSKELASLEIPLPPLPEQHEIVRRVEQLFAWADTIEKQVNNALTRVNNLTQSILAKAFRGELTAQWRAENPELISGENSAAALLEKIKAERAASGGKKTSRKKA
ncbi:4'-phosphopantetheinyl transferase [Citrobacter sp. wls830]|uniref:restriction endonuclease subunit S n=1 Tax=Citrobacter sp. wls615 TaxID=2576435 RepID=UPI0010C95C7F|nr:restriction endonuclease subunit S [Citrobacter sp. wls615]TKT96348.1 4'-phosphopantetheinyl transferase [Citrobacter sp. wls830]TKV10607.1 4'-phosphopantetheinyl transferase [Citrobacter sp. wls615]